MSACSTPAGEARDAVHRAEQKRTDGYHRGFAPGLTEGARYGLRVDGPFDPAQGHRFDAAKLLDRPQRRGVGPPVRAAPLDVRAWRRQRRRDAEMRGSRRARRRAGVRARLSTSADTIDLRTQPARLLASAHRHPRKIPRAAASPRSRKRPLVDHIKSLGVTTVEIMPADAFVDERHLPPLGLSNAWGYNPVFWGAPDPAPRAGRLAGGSPRNRRAARPPGLEVAARRGVEPQRRERRSWGRRCRSAASTTPLISASSPTISRATSMTWAAAIASRSINRTSIALALEGVAALDGVGRDRRLPLRPRAPRSAGAPAGFDSHAPLFCRARRRPRARAKAKLIAEPWDIGPGGYRLGAFPDGWGEWNDRYRDAVRRFWRGDSRIRGSWRPGSRARMTFSPPRRRRRKA